MNIVFQSRVDWIDPPRTPEAASDAPLGYPENLERVHRSINRCYIMPLCANARY